MAELLAAILELFDPKSRAGKVIWTVLGVAILAIAIIELLGALGH